MQKWRCHTNICMCVLCVSAEQHVAITATELSWLWKISPVFLFFTRSYYVRCLWTVCTVHVCTLRIFAHRTRRPCQISCSNVMHVAHIAMWWRLNLYPLWLAVVVAEMLLLHMLWKANAMIARTFRVCKFPSLFFFLSFMARSVMAFAKKYCLFLRALAASRRLWMNAEFGRRGLLKYGPTIEHYTIRDVDIFDADQQLASHIDYVCHIGWDNLRLANGYINGRSIYCYARGIKFTIVVNWKYVNWNRKYFGQRTMDNNASYSYASWTPPHTRSHFDKLCLSFALLPPKCFS